MIVKNCTDIIKEASATEEFNAADLITDELKTQYNECVKEVAVIDKSVVAYKAEMVPVFKNESTYYLELDNLSKFMMESGINHIDEAITAVAEANELDVKDFALVIESKKYMESVMESAIELAKMGSTSLLESCKLSMNLINTLKEKGIKVVTTK